MKVIESPNKNIYSINTYSSEVKPCDLQKEKKIHLKRVLGCSWVLRGSA